MLLDPDARLEIPSTVAVCPYCNGKLWGNFYSWELNERGQWKADEIVLDCEDEETSEKNHSEMPYVYQLPVDTKVLAWVNDKHHFNLDD
jgi:hypothetical protein